MCSSPGDGALCSLAFEASLQAEEKLPVLLAQARALATLGDDDEQRFWSSRIVRAAQDSRIFKSLTPCRIRNMSGCHSA